MKKFSEKQEKTCESPQYFWNKINRKSLDSGMYILLAAMAVLPIFVSLMVRPWIYMLKGAVGVKFCNYLIVGEFWHLLVYLLCAILSIFVLFGTMQRYKLQMLGNLCSKKWILAHWLGIHMFLLLCWSGLSSCFAADKQQALWGDWYCHEGLILFFFYGVVFLAGSWLNIVNMKHILNLLTGIATAAAFLTVLNIPFVEKIFYLQEPGAAMFHNLNHFGYFLSLCIPASVGLYLCDAEKNAMFRLLRLVQIWILFNALVVNTTRGSILAVAVAILGWNIYVFTLNRQRVLPIILTDILFLATVFFLNTGSLLMEELQFEAEEIAALGSASDKLEVLDEMSTSRLFSWKAGLGFAMEKPWFGYGPGNLMEPYESVGAESSSPHNDLVLIVASMGFPALIFYLSGLARHLVGFFQIVRKMTVAEVAVYAAVGSYLISSFFGVSMYYTTPYYFLLLGVSYGIFKGRYAEKST